MRQRAGRILPYGRPRAARPRRAPIVTRVSVSFQDVPSKGAPPSVTNQLRADSHAILRQIRRKVVFRPLPAP